MHITRLRISGFKTFVEPVEVPIHPGLTGIVGPNGCGKSNLVEALRWVMGENAQKAMRAASMDEVIFAGSSRRPARNQAEVILTAQNSDRKAPAAFNNEEVLEISRKILRESGSSYSINGREVRARDVQVLFADAATGARSAALVRQGQIGEIIAARPQARRRILEDAAGIAGLHSRRDEAELRLKGGEDNLARIEDIIHEISSQTESLRRQSRQATRYRDFSTDIHRCEALLLLTGAIQARQELEDARRIDAETQDVVASITREQAQAATGQALAAQTLTTQREEEIRQAAALQRLIQTQAGLEAEERRSREAILLLEKRLGETCHDQANHDSQNREGETLLVRLGDERKQILAGEAARETLLHQATQALEETRALLKTREDTLLSCQTQQAEAKARRTALEQQLLAQQARLAQARRSVDEAHNEEARAQDQAPDTNRTAHENALQDALRCQDETEQAMQALRTKLATLRTAEQQARPILQQAEKAAQKLETEAATLARLFLPDPARKTTSPLFDSLEIQPGFEAVLAALLGEEGEAPLETQSLTYSEGLRFWRSLPEHESVPGPPLGALSLAECVKAPPALSRLLSHAFLVNDSEGDALQASLAPGQVLVSREGALWRWDGYGHRKEAPSAALQRLREKNRLAALAEEASTARAVAVGKAQAMQEIEQALKTALAEETRLADAVYLLRRRIQEQQQALLDSERRDTAHIARLAALKAQYERAIRDVEEAEHDLNEANTAFIGSPAPEAFESMVLEARTAQETARIAAQTGQTVLHQASQEIALHRTRLEGINRESLLWQERLAKAATIQEDLARRRIQIEQELVQMRARPEDLQTRRHGLARAIETATKTRNQAADALSLAETTLREAHRCATIAMDTLLHARENRAAAAVRLEAASLRFDTFVQASFERFQTGIEGLRQITGLGSDTPPPPLTKLDADLTRLKAERERLGAVNLRAQEELDTIEAKASALEKERDDLIEAIRRLRQAISHLNREGRERLLAAFEIVNGHFKTLFTGLFSGGEAELTLIDSEDPLEAGLDILARPPGKKPQTMTLLSGGEQALTAIALIFAVFLTNPSPICVLDEVDAPLDDANVERYCDLLDEMARRTKTRFLVITHNPITMARMNRLIGITMAERGVSQLVSVTLTEAEALREAV
jgi:chromosome segregation protein